MPELPPGLSDDARGATYAVLSMPRDADGPVFQKPWHAQAFAMTVALQAQGLFTWHEWAAALGAEIRAAEVGNPAGDPDLSEAYYRSWLSALERVLTAKRVTTPGALAEV